MTFTDVFRATANQTLADYSMIRSGDRILACVSGGPDSTALLHYLLEIRKSFSVTIGVAHVNHCIRADEADRDECFVKDLAAIFDLPFHVTRQDVPALAARNRRSLEDEARQVRYGFFREIMEQHAYDRTALGHTRDDSVEQVLMNLVRGSGTRGLSGIPPKRDGWIIRPLIRIPKSTLLGYLDENQRTFVTDSSNQDTTLLRNRVRHQLLPLLRDSYNPQIDEALDRLSRIFRDEDAWMDEEADRFLKQSSRIMSHGEIRLPVSAVTKLPGALQRRVFRKAIRQVKGDLKRITLAHIDAVWELVHTPGGERTLDLPGRIRARRSRCGIGFVRESLPLRALGRLEKQRKKQESAAKELLA